MFSIKENEQKIARKGLQVAREFRRLRGQEEFSGSVRRKIL